MPTKNPFFDPSATDKVKEQAQQIWLAGLGAFAKAQEDGTKAFEKLVTDGITMQRKVQSTAEEKMAEASQKVSQAAHQFNERATGQWDKLEHIFEDRVSKALARLGIPNAQDMAALHARIAALEAQLGKTAKPASAPAKKVAAKKVAAKKSPAKKTSAKK
jgi:poly(hydroxyalkanoate) granule-associated protein